jgi:hypothetical protein
MGDSPLLTGATYDLLTFKFLEPEAEDTRVKTKEYVPDDTCRLPRRADNGLPKRVKYLFIYCVRRILFSFIYVSQNIYLHKKMWKYMFLADMKLYI